MARNLDLIMGIDSLKFGPVGPSFVRRTARFVDGGGAVWTLTDSPSTDTVTVTCIATSGPGPAGSPGPAGGPGPTGGPGPSGGPGPTGATGLGLLSWQRGSMGSIPSSPTRSGSVSFPTGSTPRAWSITNGRIDSRQTSGLAGDFVSYDNVSASGNSVVLSYSTQDPGAATDVTAAPFCSVFM